MFAAVTVQIDIVFTVNRLSQYLSESYKIHVYTKKSTLIYVNNQDSIDLSANLVFHSQIKHIQVQYHAIQEYIKNSKIRIQFLSTDQMLADSLIKELDHVKFTQMIEELD